MSISDTPSCRLPALALALWLPVGAAASGCGSSATAISRVQGPGDSSPLAGETVTVEGIITMDSRHEGGFRGFYLQQADDETDDNPETSEALFVYTNRSSGKPGESVRVSGRVKEFHGLTELTDIVSIDVCGKGSMPDPVSVTLPWPDGQHPEHLENMRIRIDGSLTVVDHYNLHRYGELTLAAGDQTIPTEIMAPGPPAQALFRHQQHNRLMLDDGSGARDPRPIPWPTPALSGKNTVRAGDRVSQLRGVLDFRFDAWRIQPLTKPLFERANPRTDPPSRSDDATLRVATLNLGNFFNGDGEGSGFPTARGARSAEQLREQRARLVTTLTASDPDIIAATELENDGYSSTSAIAELANALGEHWRFVATGSDSEKDAIRAGLFYRSDRVTPSGPANRLTSGAFSKRGRPPVSQVFRLAENDQALRIVVTHLKSKACRGAKGPDRDQGDGQGCYNHSREQATRAILDWVESLPGPDNLAGILITGDMNSYARERPLQLMAEAGYINTVRQRHGCDETRCGQTSYRYRGRRGTLDYSLVSEGLAESVVAASVWSVNADEPRALDYRGPIPVTGDRPWRSSDHDPVITDFSL